jgi:hypothetical protein
MKRSVGVTIIAILSLLGSAFMLVMGTVMLAVMALAPAPRSSQFPGSLRDEACVTSASTARRAFMSQAA